MKRVVVITWKAHSKQKIEVFSNLKLLCDRYPVYNYNTLNNYLSKAKLPYENDEVRIERVVVQTSASPKQEMTAVVKRVNMRKHDDLAMDTAFWLSRPITERLQAVTRLSGMLKKSKNQRMDKTHVVKRKL